MSHPTQTIIERIVSVLKEEGATEVYIFGSVANGAERATSDLDLAVRGLPPRRFFRALARASEAAGQSIDLIDLDESNPFTQHLNRSGQLRRVG